MQVKLVQSISLIVQLHELSADPTVRVWSFWILCLTTCRMCYRLMMSTAQSSSSRRASFGILAELCPPRTCCGAHPVHSVIAVPYRHSWSQIGVVMVMYTGLMHSFVCSSHFVMSQFAMFSCEGHTTMTLPPPTLYCQLYNKQTVNWGWDFINPLIRHIDLSLPNPQFKAWNPNKIVTLSIQRTNRYLS